jgi:hypothetical protein
LKSSKKNKQEEAGALDGASVFSVVVKDQTLKARQFSALLRAKSSTDLRTKFKLLGLLNF